MKKALLRGPKGQCRRSVQVERQRKAGLVEMAMSAVISLEGFVQAPDRHDATPSNASMVCLMGSHGSHGAWLNSVLRTVMTQLTRTMHE